VTENFYSSLDWCIENRRPHALCIPWVNRDSRDSLASAHRELIARGWVENVELDRYERGGWYVWFRSQGSGSAPIGQFNRIAPWGDELDGWGSKHIGFIDDSLACPDCGDYSEDGICSECRGKDSASSQLTLF
jgi:hypothetical protein